MKVYFWESEAGNFGDDMNSFLWRHFQPKLFEKDDGILFVGIGTVLADTLPAARRRVVMGSGAGYGRLPGDLSGKNWRIYAVRGPLTARVIGQDKRLAVADPAILLPLMPELTVSERVGTIFVPHWTTAAAGTWQQPCELAGIEFVDPRGEAKSVIRKIASARMVVAESMHGAIVADAFRVPWTAVVTGRDTPFKWHDWARALNMYYEPVKLPTLDDPADSLKSLLPGYRPMRRKTSAEQLDGLVQQFTDRSSRALPGRRRSWKGAFRSIGRSGARLVLSKVDLAAHAAELLTAVTKTPSSMSEEAVLSEKQEILLARMETCRRDHAAGWL